MKEMFTFEDVLIVPKFSSISSRKDVDLSFNGSGYPYMSLPIISANMDTITDVSMAKAMILNGAQACLHRFCTIDESVKMFRSSRLQETGLTRIPMVSIGLGNSELDRACALFGASAHTFIIDVAHGAQLSVVNQVKALRECIGSNGSIIVGNFATGESIKTFLEYVGNSVDGFKVGIGPGSACTTRIKTGVGYPQLSAIIDVVNTIKHTGIPVIADGGMKTSGDISKALGAGASMVMLGGMLAGTDETPGEVVERGVHLNPSGVFKKYRGSASKESYEVQGKEAKHRTSEGESFYVPYKGPVKDVLQEIEGGLRSAFTYVGASNLKEFHSKVEFVRISNATRSENQAHGAK